jgi:hypothetical protein
VGWAGYVTGMGEKRNAYKMGSKKRPLDLDVGGKILNLKNFYHII